MRETRGHEWRVTVGVLVVLIVGVLPYMQIYGAFGVFGGREGRYMRVLATTGVFLIHMYVFWKLEDYLLYLPAGMAERTERAERVLEGVGRKSGERGNGYSGYNEYNGYSGYIGRWLKHVGYIGVGIMGTLSGVGAGRAVHETWFVRQRRGGRGMGEIIHKSWRIKRDMAGNRELIRQKQQEIAAAQRRGLGGVQTVYFPGPADSGREVT